MNISVVIPVYRNIEQFVQNLRMNVTYLEGCEIILVNDYPAESIKDVTKDFKNVKVLENENNLGFGLTVNRGVKEASNNFVMLLNTDVVLQDTSYIRAIKHFEENKDLFAVSFAQVEKDGSVVGKNSFFWQKGLFFHKKESDLTIGINGWAEGGSCMIDRNKFLQLGGFDQIYRPFYWEDIDLSYRAWKYGYSILFDPKIVVEHHHEGTTGKYFLKSHVEVIAFRNQFFFIWKNITDRDLCIEHIIWFIPNLLFYLQKGKLNYIKGLQDAFPRLLDIFTTKAYNTKLTDKKIFSLFKERR